MNLDSLRAGLHDLAEEAQPADLQDRVLHTSRRIGRTRLALVAGATVLAVGIASVGMTLGRNDRALPEIATTPTPSQPPQATLPAGATAAVYLNDQSFRRLVSVWDATGRLRHFSTNDFPEGGPSQNTVRENATVSPDGAHLAWAWGDEIWITRVDGQLVGRFSNPVEEGSSFDSNCATPEFSTDSTRLLVSPTLRDYGWLTIADRSYTALAGRAPGCQVRVNGEWAAYVEGNVLYEGKEYVGVMNLRTGESWRMPDLPNGQTAVDVVSMSPDGSRVTAHLASGSSGSSSRTLQADIVLDTRTGQPVEVATRGRAVRQLLYQPDGNLVARVTDGDRTRLMIFAPDGRLISDDLEAAELQNSLLMRLVAP